MNSDATAGGAFPGDSGWEISRFGGEAYWLVGRVRLANREPTARSSPGEGCVAARS